MASHPSDSREYPPHGLSEYSSGSAKRVRSEDDLPDSPAKKIKGLPEEPSLYSESVRKKLAATNRTGQACDRCKERKMKCDPDPIACQPCRQKNLRCYTTDRVTGQSRERGQADRVETEIMYLRDQVAAYQQKFGPVQPRESLYSPYPAAPSPATDRKHSHPELRRDSTLQSAGGGAIPSLQYVGWPAPEHAEPLHRGPVDGTKVDILGSEMIDIAGFDCEMMHDYPIDEFNHFNSSKNSVTNTMALRQRIEDPGLPSKDQALSDAQNFVHMMNQFMPIVHAPSFIDLVHRLYDHPSSVRLSERVQVILVLAIMAQQFALRNHSQYQEKIDQCHRYFHYAMGFYQDLYREQSVSSMQAMALILLLFRCLPKPGYTWAFSHTCLIRAMDMEYHRDPDKIELPPEDQNPLARELRKRVFHSILSVCVTTGCRVGRPAPWQFSHLDVPLPMAIKDSEISVHGITNPLSGECDFWPAIQLAKLLPLLTELYNYVISVRRSEQEYVKIVEALKTKIDAWRADWDKAIANEKPGPFLNISGLLMDTWAAEFLLNLHHPSVCTAKSTEILEKNLDVCHKQARRLLSTFHILSGRYKAVDFTWHSAVAYALGFGATLHVYQKRLAVVSQEQFEAMRNELNGWLSLVAYADLVLRTGNHLQRIFQPRIQQLEDNYRAMMPRNSSIPRGSFSHVNGPSTRLPVKSEPSPQQKTYSVVPTPAPISTPPAAHHGVSQPSNYPMPTSYMPHPAVTSANYSHAGYSPSIYQSVPTSLAPLLNEPMPNGFIDAYGQFNSNDVSMIFSPTHYTDNTTSWPSMSTGQYSGA